MDLQKNNSKHIQINLSEIIKAIGEDGAKSILSSFSSPNKDVENFLKYKAIEFSKRDFSKTHLVFWSTLDEKEKYLVGYYTIAPKFISISKDIVSNSQYKKLSQYGEYDTYLKKCTISATLIGQLGKNYTDGNDTLITGDELLKLALDKVKSIQTEIGGRYTYLECEDTPFLLSFYERNGFSQFGKRQLDADETDINGSYLIQLLKKI